MIAKISAVSKVFTVNELFQLLCYELCCRIKKNANLIAYIFIILVWLGISTIIYNMFKLTDIVENEAHIIEINKKTEVAQVVEKPDYSKVFEEIDRNKSKDAYLESDEIYSKVLLYTNAFNVESSLVLAIIEKESNFKETAIAKDYSKTKSLGWSQASKATWDTFNAQYVWPIFNATWPEIDKNNPDKSLVFICWYVNWLKKHYPEKTATPYDIYRCYNGGVNGIDKPEVKRNADAFQKIYDRYFIAIGG